MLLFRLCRNNWGKKEKMGKQTEKRMMLPTFCNKSVQSNKKRKLIKRIIKYKTKLKAPHTAFYEATESKKRNAAV
jgi:predicted restriction endonuclease